VENADGAEVCSGCGFILAESSAAPPAGAVEGKTSGLAITSFVLGMLSLFCAIFTAIPAIICGIISLVKISKSQGRLKGNGFAIAGIAVPAVSMLLILPLIMAIMLPALSKTKAMAQRVVCATNLKGLGIAMYVYANNYDDTLPTADKWCDLLTSQADVNPVSFRCASAPEVSFSYALNENLAGRGMKDVSPDVVMLFEADAGPNAVGGPEMLVSDRHKVGCNIVFVDGHVEFIKESEIGNLKWTVEEKTE
jgi:prepilin-type processing-associated H-X9-DG protein